MSAADNSSARDKRVIVNYLAEMEERPRFHVHQRERDNLRLLPRTVTLENARAAASAVSLEQEGFCLVRHRTAVADLKSRRALLRVYRSEIAELIRELTGASEVIAEPLAVMRINAERDRPVHAPVRFVHTDYTDDSALATFRTFLGRFDTSGRREIYNLWRVLTDPPHDCPLACCDVRTVAADDCVPADTVLDFPGSRPSILEATLLRFNPAHRWYYFPDMTRDEVLVFKGFVSGAAYRGRVPHTAFDDPACPRGTSPRTSVDVRAFAIFDSRRDTAALERQ